MATKSKAKAKSPSPLSYLDAAQAAMARARSEGTTIKGTRHENGSYRTFYDFDGSNGELWTVTVTARGEKSCSCPAHTICKHLGAVLTHLLDAQDAQRQEIEDGDRARAAALPYRPVDSTGPFLYRGAF